uniref:Ion transport domain-containing protein n=1 Tax=Biomphalaria glabrata TaxID=6526 RepID=A0A2C9LTI8_BIOGL
MMGEYFLDEIEHSEYTCINLKAANSSIKSCPTADGTYSIPILLAAYVLFVQILMFNLLVALFNNDITANESKRDMIWSYQKFRLTIQYSKSKILLPPCLFFYFFLKVGNPFKSHSENYMALQNFELGAAQKMRDQIIRLRYGKKNAEDDKKEIKDMKTKVNKILKLIQETSQKHAEQIKHIEELVSGIQIPRDIDGRKCLTSSPISWADNIEIDEISASDDTQSDGQEKNALGLGTDDYPNSSRLSAQENLKQGPRQETTV